MVEVFVWEMFKTGVGHASMFVRGRYESAYISWWPTPGTGVTRALHGIASKGLVHSIRADKEEDGTPDWCSKPLHDLDEEAIIKWWKTIARTPNLRTGSEMANVGHYVFETNNCSSTVVRALMLGATMDKRIQIQIYLFKQSLLGGSLRNAERFIDRAVVKAVAGVGSEAAISRSALETGISIVNQGRVVAPYDCRNIVEEVWGSA